MMDCWHSPVQFALARQAKQQAAAQRPAQEASAGSGAAAAAQPPPRAGGNGGAFDAENRAVLAAMTPEQVAKW